MGGSCVMNSVGPTYRTLKAVTDTHPQPYKEAFSDFYHREYAPSVRQAVLLVGSGGVAHDVVQDAFVGVYRRWGTLENPGGYLRRSVINGCRDVARRRASNLRLVHKLERGHTVDARGDVLDDMLRRLAFNQRAAVVLRFYADLTTNEIAEVLGCPAGSVGPWIERALTAMRKALQ
jgi:RNA polymerase sigma factor (sigma-70 family)